MNQSLNYVCLLIVHLVTLYNPPFTLIMNGIQCICKLLINYVWDHVIFPVKIQILKRIHVPYIRVFVRFKDDKHVM